MSVSIVFEGPEGVGKTTQSTLLAEFLRRYTNAPVLQVREPGGTKVGEAIRQLLFTEDFKDMHPNTFLNLFTGARSEVMHKVVFPFLRDKPEGVSVGDRDWWSSFTLQKNDGVDENYIRNTQEPYMNYPDTTIYLDLPAEESMIRVEVAEAIGERRNWRDKVRLETYHSIRNNYLMLVKEHRDKTYIIDGFKSPWDILWESASKTFDIMSKNEGCRELGEDCLRKFTRDDITKIAHYLDKEHYYNFEKNTELEEKSRKLRGFPDKETLRRQMYQEWHEWGIDGEVGRGLERK